MKYIGVPVTFANLKAIDWDFLDAKMLKKLDAWIGNSASSGGRLTLLDSSLSGIPSYYMSMFLLSKGFVEKLDKHRRKFFWSGSNSKRKYHMVKWTRVCRSKKKGVWELRIFENRTSAFFVSGGGSWKHNLEFGRTL